MTEIDFIIASPLMLFPDLLIMPDIAQPDGILIWPSFCVYVSLFFVMWGIMAFFLAIFWLIVGVYVFGVNVFPLFLF
jgi:hypothetical protein